MPSDESKGNQLDAIGSLAQRQLDNTLERYLGDRFEVSGSNAGIHVLVWLSGFDERALSELTQRAAEDGVGLYSAAPYYATPKKARAGLLFGYGSLDVGQIEEGVRRFASYVS